MFEAPGSTWAHQSHLLLIFCQNLPLFACTILCNAFVTNASCRSQEWKLADQTWGNLWFKRQFIFPAHISLCIILTAWLSWGVPRSHILKSAMCLGQINLISCFQGCPQAIAHSDWAIYSNELHYLLFQNYCRITVMWVLYALSTYENQCLALSILGKSLSTLKFRDTPVFYMKNCA